MKKVIILVFCVISFNSLSTTVVTEELLLSPKSIRTNFWDNSRESNITLENKNRFILTCSEKVESYNYILAKFALKNNELEKVFLTYKNCLLLEKTIYSNKNNIVRLKFGKEGNEINLITTTIVQE
jgi:hypothetical protein